MLKSAAIKRISDGKIWTGYRHKNVINKIFRLENITSISTLEFIWGFITDKGKFVDWPAAYNIAEACGQLLEKNDPWAVVQIVKSDNLPSDHQYLFR